jgi:hypothetical protein
MIYLVELTGWNPATQALGYVRAATAGYVSRPTDTPANAIFEPILATALSVETSLFASGTTGGGSAVGAGDIELINDKAALDPLLDWDWAGHPVRVWSLPTAGSPFSAATLIFRGSIVQPEFGLDRVRFTLRDRTADLEVPVCPNRFKGDNVPPHGDEGGPELTDVVKPRALGVCRNVTPKLVNEQLLIRKVSDGPAVITMVYDSGLSMDRNMIASGDFSQLSPWFFNPDAWDEEVEYDAAGQRIHYYKANQFGGGGVVYQRVKAMTAGARYRLTFDLSVTAAGTAPRMLVDVIFGHEDEDGEPHSQSVYYFDQAATSLELSGHVVEFVANGPHNAFAVQVAFLTYGGYITQGDGYLDNVSLYPVVRDYADLAALEAAAIHAGSYATCNAIGEFRQGSDASGEVTADVLGEGSAAAPDLALGLGRQKFADADIDLPAFAALKVLTAAEVGLYVDDETSIAAALDAVLGSVGAWWTLTPTGILTCGRFEAPSGIPAADVVVDADVLESGGIDRVATADGGNGVPAYKVTVGHQRNWTVQTSALLGSGVYMNQDVVGAVTNERRTWLNAELRTTVAEDAALKARLPGAVELRVDTLLDSPVEAAAEAARLLALYKVRRDRYTLRLPRRYFGGLGLGHVIRLTWDRLGLAGGKLFRVIGQGVTVDGDSDILDLDVWG